MKKYFKVKIKFYETFKKAKKSMCKKGSYQTYLIEFAFESVVVEIIGDVLQFAMLVEMESGIVGSMTAVLTDFIVV